MGRMNKMSDIVNAILFLDSAAFVTVRHGKNPAHRRRPERRSLRDANKMPVAVAASR
jgi:hypothetical protein